MAFSQTQKRNITETYGVAAGYGDEGRCPKACDAQSGGDVLSERKLESLTNPYHSPQSETTSPDEQSVPWRKYLLAVMERKHIYANPLILAPALMVYASPFVLFAICLLYTSDAADE